MLLLLIATVSIASAFVVDENTPIGMKWVKSAANPQSACRHRMSTRHPTDWHSDQRFEKGVIVYSSDFGAVLISNAIFAKWLTLTTQTTASGTNLFQYVGVPIKDYTVFKDPDPGPYPEGGNFEKGMIVAYPDGSAYTVSGSIYLHYMDVKDTVGLPTSEEQAVAGSSDGRYQAFSDGRLYYSPSVCDSAHMVYGAIYDRWMALGGPTGSMGFPFSDVESIAGAATESEMCHFVGGDIYYSSYTGAWELTGEVRNAYKDRFGGPTGWLGLPISGQGSTPTSGGVYNDFQNGIVVYHASGPYKGVVALNNLQLYAQRIEGYGDDWWLGVAGAQDVYFNIKVTTSSTGLIVNERVLLIWGSRGRL